MLDAPRSKPLARSAPPATKGRTTGRDAASPPSARPDLQGTPLHEVRTGAPHTTGTPQGLQMGEALATAGQHGERSIVVNWVDVWIGNTKPCRFDVTTLPDHPLEVVVEQAAYTRRYTGTGALSTQPVPYAPNGTPLKVTATDTATGETVEQTGVWNDVSGGGASIWQFIKRMFWKR